MMIYRKLLLESLQNAKKEANNARKTALNYNQDAYLFVAYLLDDLLNVVADIPSEDDNSVDHLLWSISVSEQLSGSCAIDFSWDDE